MLGHVYQTHDGGRDSSGVRWHTVEETVISSQSATFEVNVAKKAAKTALVVDDLNTQLRAGALRRLQGNLPADPAKRKTKQPKRRAKKRERNLSMRDFHLMRSSTHERVTPSVQQSLLRKQVLFDLLVTTDFVSSMRRWRPAAAGYAATIIA